MLDNETKVDFRGNLTAHYSGDQPLNNFCILSQFSSYFSTICEKRFCIPKVFRTIFGQRNIALFNINKRKLSTETIYLIFIRRLFIRSNKCK